MSSKASYSTNNVLADSSAGMSLVDKMLAERLGFQYTRKKINFGIHTRS